MSLFESNGLDCRDPNNLDYVEPPQLISAKLDNQDVFMRINEVYGKKRNWCCKFWQSWEIFGNFEGERNLRIDWINEKTGHRYYLEENITNQTVVNPTLLIPQGSYWGSLVGY